MIQITAFCFFLKSKSGYFCGSGIEPLIQLYVREIIQLHANYIGYHNKKTC